MDNWVEILIILLAVITLGALVYHFLPNTVSGWASNTVQNILSQFP